MKSVFRIMLLFPVGVLAVRLAGADELLAQNRFSPENIFKRVDADGDGKISKDEWKRFSAGNPRLKDSGKADAIFSRLDANMDGVLSFDEFKKLLDLQKGRNNPNAKKEPEAKKEPAVDKPAAAEQIAFFEKKIRPVLVKECYSCHSADAPKIKGGLALDSRAGWREGGENGPAIIPCDPKRSLLLKAIKHQDEKLKMPKDKLGDDVIADFEKWIVMGAADPREAAARVAPKSNMIDIEKGRRFWAFQPPKKPPVPKENEVVWPHAAATSDIDRFILAGLEAKALKPVADADAATMVRRLHFDLVGLPPTEEEASLFAKEYARDPQAAVEAAADKLLASSRFGERWGRHWLDVARYAESSGKQANFVYPHAWRYRDYVIDAFNADKPFDQFIREQLAGDLIPAKDDKERAEHLVATGFLAIGPKSHNERSARQFQMDLVDEQIDATFLVFQGLTVACARCHDHKFDPIPTRDYYALAGIFLSTDTCYGTVRTLQNNHPSQLLTLPKGANVPAALEPLLAERRADLEKQLKEQREEYAKQNDKFGNFKSIRLRVQIANLESQLASFEADGAPKPLAMGVRDRSRPTNGKILIRGELNQEGETVTRGLPQVLAAKAPNMDKGSGRRQLADWIASRDNPLTARVMANRIWLHLIGRGLVATPDNFGASGQLPSNQPLLDYLAVTFTEKGYSVKQLIRTIVVSRVYRLSSQFDERNYETDPDNVLVWRMPKRRLEAEALRDAMLAISAKLDVNPPKGSPMAKNGEGDVNFALRFRGVDQFASDIHRSAYMPIVRDQLPEVLTLFDFPDPTLIAGERSTTTIPAQSLYLMNNTFVIRQAEAVAEALLASGDADSQRLARAYRMFYSRAPSAKEEKLSLEFIERYGKTLAAENKGAGQSRRAAWAALCQSLFASAEFSHR